MVTENISNTCCFFGNRKINETEELKTQLHEAIESLIINENVSLFLFGSRSEFDKLCLKSVTEIKEKYPHIKRIYVRAEYPVITDLYKDHLLESYDDTYFPEKIKNAGKAAYVERNYEMIDNSRFCIVYYDDNSANSRKSGTRIALEYAVKKGKEIIRFPKESIYNE